MVPISHNNKRQNGRYYTEGNPFLLKPFIDWVKKNKLSKSPILEPFAGSNNIIRALKQIGLASNFSSFDISPNDPEVLFRDTLEDFPTGFDFCVTNPPWLAKNSAKRRGLDFPDTQFDDLYKHCLAICLKNCKYVAAIIPATFLRSESFHEHLESVIFLHDQRMFTDTDNPVCLALFSRTGDKISLYNDNEFVGYYDELKRKLPEKSINISITFNEPSGVLGLIAIDNTKEPSIRFVKGEDVASYDIGFSSRMITRIDFYTKDIDDLINRLNEDLKNFRKETKDVFLTPFKGLRKDGWYRRRMDYSLARDFIAKHANPNTRF